MLDAALLLLLALLPFLVYWRLFTAEPADQQTIAEGDFFHEYLPLAVTAARALRAGELPLWNPYSNAGQPLLADPQNALLYPPTWLALAGLRGFVTPAGFALEPTAALQRFDAESVLAFERLVPLHLALASAGAYLLGRVWTGARTGGLVVALTFAYSGALQSYPVQQLPILRVAAWLPLLVLLLSLALERRSARWAAAAGVALGLALLAGHPQTALFALCALAILLLARAGRDWRAGSSWPALLGQGARCLLALAVGLGLAAAQLLPTLEFVALSGRASATYAFVSGGFGPRELTLNLLAPRVLGGLPVYVGVLPLVLAGAGLLLARGWTVGFGAGSALFGLLLSLGGNTFLFPVLYQLVPGFDLFRNQERAILLWSFGVAVLAGVGAAALVRPLGPAARRALRGYRRVLLGVGALAALVGGALGGGWLAAEFGGPGLERWRRLADGYAFFLLMLGLAIGVVWLRGAGPPQRGLGCAGDPGPVRPRGAVLPLLLGGLILLDLATASGDSNRQDRRPDDVYRASEIVAALRADPAWGRVVDEGVLNGNHGLVYGLATIGESFALRVQRVDELRAALSRQTLHDLLGVRAVVSREPRPEDGPVVLEERWRDQTNRLTRRSPAPERAYFPAVVTVVEGPEEALRRLAAPGFDARSEAVIERGAVPPGREVRAGAGRVEEVRAGWNWLEVRAETPTGGLLVLRETAYPGWRAEVDGGAAPLLTSNHALRAVALPPGRHVVRLSYEPGSLRLGLALTLLTLAGLLAWLVAGLVRWRQGSPAAAPPKR